MNLENIRVFIQSWINLTEETITHFTSIFSQLIFKNIKSLEIGFEWYKFYYNLLFIFIIIKKKNELAKIYKMEPKWKH